MKNPQRKTLTLSSRFGRTAAAALVALASTVFASCSDKAATTCGTGTVLDASTNTCIAAAGDLNVIVDDFSLGKFKFSNVDVPERLDVGTPEKRTLTITNEGKDDRAVVSIRYALVPVKERIEELREQLEEVDDSSKLDATFVGSLFIDDLRAGESRTLEYEYFLPSTLTPGLFGLFFAVDEVPLVKNEDGSYAVNLADGTLGEQEGTVRLDDAALVFAPATVIVGKPDRANLRVLSGALDNASFEVDASGRGSRPMFTLNARMSSQALDVTEPVQASFRLRLPGHVVDVPGQDLGQAAFASEAEFLAAPDATSYRFDPDRSFALLMMQTGGGVESKTYTPMCRSEDSLDAETQEVVTKDHCAVVFTEEGRDDVFELHLTTDASRLLEQTRALPGVNPGLDANGELVGTVEMVLTTTQAEYQDNKADNVKSFDVVFMAPEPAAAAADTDTDDGGVTQSPNAVASTGPYNYSVRDTTNGKWSGGEWFGAGHSFDVEESNAQENGIVSASYKKNDYSFTLRLFKKDISLASASGLVDWGARDVASNRAQLQLDVFGLRVFRLMYAPAVCTTANSLTYCNVWGKANADATRPKNQKYKEPPKPGTEEEEGSDLLKEYNYNFMAGPVPVVIMAKAGVETGLKFGLNMVIDRSGPVPDYGLEAYAGPFASLGAYVFGGVQLGILRAGVEGSLQIFAVNFTPSLRFGMSHAKNSAESCYLYADSSCGTQGRLTFTGPNGRVGIVVFMGITIKIFKWKKTREQLIWSYTIAEFSTFEYTLVLWDEVFRKLRIPGDAGMCADALPVGGSSWHSPTTCGTSAAPAYCAKSTNRSTPGLATSLNQLNSAYWRSESFVPGYCLKVSITGVTRADKDLVTVWTRGVKAPAMTTSGVVDSQFVVCPNNLAQPGSESVAVALETAADAPATYPGVNVTFAPVAPPFGTP